jgi:hypothetical protein
LDIRKRGGYKERVWEGECTGNIMSSCMNREMRPVETVQEWGKGEIKENDGWGKFNCDILQECLWMSQCTPSTIII